MNDIKSNKEFIETIELAGLLKNINDQYKKELSYTSIDLRESYNKLCGFIRNNNIRYEKGEKTLSIKCLSEFVMMNKNHGYKGSSKEFLDYVLYLYKLGTSKNKLTRGTLLLLKFVDLRLSTSYLINLDCIRIKYIRSERIGIDDKSSLPGIVEDNNEIVYAYIIKNEEKEKILDKDKVIPLILKRDYDLIYLPFIEEKTGRDVVKNYTDYGWMSNYDYMDFLKIFKVISTYEGMNTIEYKEVCESKYDLKPIIKELFLLNQMPNLLNFRISIYFLRMMIGIINDKEDITQINSKIRILSNIINYLNNLTYNYNKCIDTLTRLFYESKYNSLDDMIKRFKLLNIYEILGISINKEEEYIIKDKILYVDYNKNRSKTFDISNSIVIYRDNSHKVIDTFDDSILNNDEVLLVINGKKYED